MTEPRRAILVGTGAYLPEQIVTNAQMAERVDTSDEWIVERTGIRQRHFSAPHETAAYMGAAAARCALEQAGMAPEDVGAIIVATSTPDQAFARNALAPISALSFCSLPDISRCGEFPEPVVSFRNSGRLTCRAHVKMSALKHT